MRYLRSNKLILVLLFSFLTSFFSCPVTFAQGTISFTQNVTTVQTYAIEEITVTLPRTYTNPYDPAEIDVYALITRPGSSTAEKVIGFWSENVIYNPSGGSNRYTITPNSGTFKVRYAPPTTGTYTFRIEAKDSTGTLVSQNGSFTATSSTSKGFIVRDPQNPTRLMYENGTPFIALGTNLAWSDQNKYDFIHETPGNDNLFEILKQSKMNFARIWAAFDPAPHFLLEWTGTKNHVNNSTTWQGIGKYNQENAYKLDNLFKSAQAKDIYIELTVLTFHNFNDWAARNPYEILLGGNDLAFWTNETARRHFRNYVRYMAARYGAYTSFGVFEYWNEIDQGANRPDMGNATHLAMVAAWHVEMVNALHASYPRPLLTATSFASWGKPWNDGTGSKSYLAIPSVDMVQPHHYDESANNANMAWGWGDMARFGSRIGNRPFILGEYGVGLNDDYQNAAYAKKLDRLNHHSTWVPIFHGNAAGSNLHWRLNFNFVPPENFRKNYQRFATWMEPELSHLKSMTWFYDGDSAYPNFWAGGYKKADRALLYFLNKTALWNREDNDGLLQAVSSKTYTINNLTNGTYRIEFTTDSYPGGANTISSTTLSTTNGSITFTLPTFLRDVAVKVIPATSITNTPTPIRKIGDMNGNGTVTIADYNLFISTVKSTNTTADFNTNGSVDIFDYSLLIRNFGN